VTVVFIPGPLKTLIRVVVAMFGTIFGSLAGSVQVCTYAARQPVLPHWADFICGPNVWVFWLVSAPLLCVLIVLLLGKRLAPFRRHAAVVLLATYGLYGLIEWIGRHDWWMALSPAVALIAATAVALGKRWARFLVYALAIALVVLWGYAVLIAGLYGYFRDVGAGMAILSLLPGVAFLLFAAFCCYSVANRKTPENRP
jgi:hypothetical protein